MQFIKMTPLLMSVTNCPLASRLSFAWWRCPPTSLPDLELYMMGMSTGSSAGGSGSALTLGTVTVSTPSLTAARI